MSLCLTEIHISLRDSVQTLVSMCYPQIVSVYGHLRIIMLTKLKITGKNSGDYCEISIKYPIRKCSENLKEFFKKKKNNCNYIYSYLCLRTSNKQNR